jgi:hypothetical protein
MADKKISALTGASTPLAGTEVLPIVQSGATVKVAVSDLTAGRAVSTSTITGTTSLILGAAGSEGRFNANGAGIDTVPAAGKSFRILNAAQSASLLSMAENVGDLNVSAGNVVIGTSGKGIDFSATPSTGTSELLADYEEGTWTPVVTGTSTAGTYEIGVNGSTYTKIGRTVTLQGFIQFAAVVTGGGTGSLQITGLPFTKTANSYPTGSVYLALGTYTGIDPIVVFGSFSTSSQLILQQNASGGYGSLIVIGFASANAYLTFTLSYEV